MHRRIIYNKACTLSVSICIFSIAFAQNTKFYSAADTLYSKLNDLISLRDIDMLSVSDDSAERARFIKTSQSRFAQYRDLGLIFWKTYPDDPRRYDWLVSAVSIGSSYSYWKNIDTAIATLGTKKPRFKYDIPIDTDRLYSWERIYPKLRNAFVNFVDKNREELQTQYYRLLIGELHQFLMLSLNNRYRIDGKIDLSRLEQLFLMTSEILLEKTGTRQAYRTSVLNLMDYNFVSIYKQYGLTDNDFKQFIDRLQHSDNIEVRQWASQRKSLINLKKTEFKFRYKSIEGIEVDFALLRNKVVLIDFWATWCSSCIARMPAIKKVYDKYKAKGFEVLSVSVNYESDLDKVIKVKEQIGADWPTFIIGGESRDKSTFSLGKWIWNIYGFSGVPQLLLFNKSGRLVMINDILQNGNIDKIVCQLLNEKN